MVKKEKAGIVFACMGNICRSPTAEAVFRRYAENAGLAGQVLIDSAGTHDYHVGEPPDSRAQQAARQRGYDMSSLRGRQVEEGDFRRFDYVLAMDRDNLSILQRLMPPGGNARVQLFLDYARHYAGCEVPPTLIAAARKASSACWIWWRMRRRDCCGISGTSISRKVDGVQTSLFAELHRRIETLPG